MSDIEWVLQELRHFQKEELEAAKRIENADAALAKAEAELATAKESLAGARGCIAEFEFQMKHLKEEGKLP
jgi:predicted  nucleic acid-binding Zn-ribbon protein